MLYLSPTATSEFKDSRFSSRGIARQAQGPVSRVDLHALPDVPQVAYSTYKANIDAFLAATALNQKVTVTTRSFTLPHVRHTFPLDLPNVVISFKLKADNLKLSYDLLKVKSGTVTKVENVAKHPDAFLVTRPEIGSIKTLAPMGIEPPRVEGACSPEAMLAIHLSYSAVELYMRTNTYPAFKGDESDEATFPQGSFSKRIAVRDIAPEFAKIARYGGGLNVDHKMGEDKTDTKENGLWLGKLSDADKEIEYDLGAEVVYTAKPSPSKSSAASYGPPSTVPSLPGIGFEWFEGMNTADTVLIRNMTSRLFLRCMGTDPQKAYVRFRQDVSQACTTKQGIILAHMMKGIEISLETQTRFYAMFDGRNYLGFVILGAKWRLRIANVWHLPLPASELAEELGTIKTHASSLEEVVVMLNSEGLMVEKEDIKTPMQLAELLHLIVWDGTEKEVKEKQGRLQTTIGRLDFRVKPVGFGIDTLVRALQDIADPSADISSQPVFFPEPSHYDLFKERSGLVLARFGSRTPSFVISKGQGKVAVGEKFFQEEKEGAVDGRIKELASVMVAEKPFHIAAKDFRTFLENPQIFQTSTERAADYRHHKFTDAVKAKSKTTLVTSLKALTGSIKGKAKAGPVVGKEKAPAVSEDDFFAALRGQFAKVASRASSVVPE